MKNIRDIMKICKCTELEAFSIFQQMGMDGLDFSECTNAEFKRAALEAARTVKV